MPSGQFARLQGAQQAFLPHDDNALVRADMTAGKSVLDRGIEVFGRADALERQDGGGQVATVAGHDRRVGADLRLTAGASRSVRK